ncbi:hypothetical protein FF38_11289 [Lucilia cuprina]|uniref:Uncharacterized protein n=1 Tax=Lucilia cuprina TaxID=7375 RepID=A0A0L0CIY4_LUCCU|nr:hypothetical protein FF38_11289 [Lucilia cuprina]
MRNSSLRSNSFHGTILLRLSSSTSDQVHGQLLFRCLTSAMQKNHLRLQPQPPQAFRKDIFNSQLEVLEAPLLTRLIITSRCHSTLWKAVDSKISLNFTVKAINRVIFSNLRDNDDFWDTKLVHGSSQCSNVSPSPLETSSSHGQFCMWKIHELGIC